VSVDELRHLTVDGRLYFLAEDVERWHRGTTAAADLADAVADAAAELLVAWRSSRPRRDELYAAREALADALEAWEKR